MYSPLRGVLPPLQRFFDIWGRSNKEYVHVVLQHDHGIFSDMFTALKQLMLEKEAELALTNNELAELEEYQVIMFILYCFWRTISHSQ